MFTFCKGAHAESEVNENPQNISQVASLNNTLGLQVYSKETL